jgi:glycosyltransferase involved in cell wall biosynthesis
MQTRGEMMKITKILFINAAGFIGGDNAMLLLGLPFLPPDSFEIHVVTIPRGLVYQQLRKLPKAKITEMELGGKELSPTGRFAGWQRVKQTLAAIPKIVKLVEREGIHIIYTGDRTVSMLISYLVSLLTRKPLILNAQITHYLDTSPLHHMVVRHAERITVSSEHMRRKFTPFVRRADRLIKIPNAITVAKFDPTLSGEKARVALDLPEGEPVITLAGRLNPYKGPEEFIRAAAMILEERPHVNFIIAGGEDIPGYRKQLQKLIDQLGVSQRVKMIGHHPNIAEVLSCTTISTMPSYEEPFGLVALEAMAMRKPVVATRAGGVPEYFLDGEIGILIPPRDPSALAQAVQKLLDNPQLAAEMGRKGRKHVETYYSDWAYAARIADVLFSTGIRSLEYKPSLSKELS